MIRFSLNENAVVQGLNAILFNENKDPSEYYSLIPTSAHTGDGMGNLIALICEMTQKMFADRVMFSEELKATVMEVSRDRRFPVFTDSIVSMILFMYCVQTRRALNVTLFAEVVRLVSNGCLFDVLGFLKRLDQ